MSNRKSLTEQIRQLIDESGQSRYRIAKECGIDHSVMSRFMGGTSGLSMHSLDVLAEYLGWTLVANRKTHRSNTKKTET